MELSLGKFSLDNFYGWRFNWKAFIGKLSLENFRWGSFHWGSFRWELSLGNFHLERQKVTNMYNLGRRVFFLLPTTFAHCCLGYYSKNFWKQPLRITVMYFWWLASFRVFHDTRSKHPLTFHSCSMASVSISASRICWLIWRRRSRSFCRCSPSRRSSVAVVPTRIPYRRCPEKVGRDFYPTTLRFHFVTNSVFFKKILKKRR